MTTIDAPREAALGAAPVPAKRGRGHAGERAGIGTYIVLTLTAALFLFPFYFSLVAGSHPPADLYDGSPPLLPGPGLFTNMGLALQQADLFQALGRSLIVSLVVTVATVFFCTMAGFAFAKLKFRGRNALFGITLATLTIPPTLGIVPLYVVMSKLGLVNNLASVILPAAVTAFGVFFMRQFLTQALPDELVEAATVDVASLTRTLFEVVFPIARPGMAVLGILSFMASWNDLFGPLIFLTSPENQTLPIALAQFQGEFYTQIGALMAAATITVIPVLVVFLLAQRYFVQGVTGSAFKG